MEHDPSGVITQRLTLASHRCGFSTPHHGLILKLIQAGKPTQNSDIESFNGKFRDECLNEYWFRGLSHARGLMSLWRMDYNESRPTQLWVAWLLLSLQRQQERHETAVI